MAQTYGNDLTDLQQGRLLEKDRQDRAASDYRNYLSTLSGQRSQERVATRDLDQQNQQYYAGLGQQDKQFRDELALRKYAAETGNSQFLAELDLRKKVAEAERGYMETAGKAQVMSSLAQIMAAMRSGITSGNRSSAIAAYGAQFRDAARRLSEERAKTSALEAEVNAANSFLQEKASANKDGWFWSERSPEDARKKVISDADASGPIGWLEQTKPELAGRVTWDGTLNGGVGGFKLNKSPEELQFKAEYDETKSVLNNLLSGNAVNDSELSTILSDLDTIASKLGVDTSEYLPARTTTSAKQSKTPVASQDAGGYLASEAGPAVKKAPAASKYREGDTAVNKKTGQRMIYKNGAWQPL